MEIIPLIKLKKSRLYENDIYSSQDDLEKLVKRQTESGEIKKIYILDIDGIEKGKPNLCIYQKLSPSIDLWVDNGPRNLGDVVDSFMAGATDITIRKNLFPKLNISDIREISENKIYANIDFEKPTMLSNDMFFFDVDGLVNLNGRKEVELNPENSDLLNKIRLKKKIYSYESDPKNLLFWKRFDMEDFLVDIGRIKEFKNGS